MNEIILTHAGKLGDFLYSLPVASWLARNRQASIHWVLPKAFGPFNYCERLLMNQPFTSRVSLVAHRIENYDCGGQPYQFNPADYGIQGEYYNIGFRGYPNKFLPAFYADEHGFGYDPHFRLRIVGKITPSEEKLRTREGAMIDLAPDAETLPPAVDLNDLALRLKGAKKVYSWYCGIAVLCWYADIPATVFRVPGHGAMQTYFPEPRSLQFVEVEKP